jgi:chitin disaccharide deacetylase
MRPYALATASLAALAALTDCASRRDPPASLQEELGYPKGAILAIVHADDLGMHPDESADCLDVLSYGLAKSASVIVPAPDFERFAAARYPGLDLGVHVAFTSEWRSYRWAPLLPAASSSSLRDAEGRFPGTMEAFEARARADEAASEMRSQVDRAIDAGIRPTHLDAHMGSFLNPRFFPEAMKVAVERNLVLACAFPGSKAILESRGLVAIDSMDCVYSIEGEEANPGLRAEAYRAWMRSLGPGLHYLATHPAKLTPALAAIVEMPYIRSGDKAFWTSPETKAFAAGLGIEFIGMRELQALQAKRLAQAR